MIEILSLIGYRFLAYFAIYLQPSIIDLQSDFSHLLCLIQSMYLNVSWIALMKLSDIQPTKNHSQTQFDM